MSIDFKELPGSKILTEREGVLTNFEYNISGGRISSITNNNNRLDVSVQNNVDGHISDSYTATLSYPYQTLKTYSKNGSVLINIGHAFSLNADNYGGSANGSISIQLTDGTTTFTFYTASTGVSSDSNNTTSHSTSTTGLCTPMIFDLKNLVFYAGKAYQSTATTTSGGSASSPYSQLTNETDLSALDLELTTLNFNFYSAVHDSSSVGTTTAQLCIAAGGTQ